jgi:hypothetical protein
VIVYSAVVLLEDSRQGSEHQADQFRALMLMLSLLVWSYVGSRQFWKIGKKAAWWLVVIESSVCAYSFLGVDMRVQWESTAATTETRLFGKKSSDLVSIVDDISHPRMFQVNPIRDVLPHSAGGENKTRLLEKRLILKPLQAYLLKSEGNGGEKSTGGYLLPRLFTVPFAIEDPKGEITKSLSLKQGEQKLFQSAVFINESILDEKVTPDSVRQIILKPDEIRLKKTADLIDVTEEFAEVDWGQSIIRTNIVLEDKEDCSISNVNKCAVGENRSAELNDILRNSAPARRNTKLLDSRRSGWIEMDFGEDAKVAINRIKMTYENFPEAHFGKRAVHLYGSHTGERWSRVGWFMHANADRSIPEQTLYKEINDQKYRYYRIEIEPGKPDLQVDHLMQMSFGYFGRKINAAPIREISIPIPLLSFKNQGPTEDGENLIFSYYIDRKHGVDITTNPKLSFAYNFNVGWENEDGSSGARLRPTWANEWYDSNLFQVSYQNPGYLEISIPAKDAKKYRKRLIKFTVTTVETGVRLLDYTADKLKMTVNGGEHGRWLYYADGWDKYWKAKTLLGQTLPVYKANYQFKTVYIPPGLQTITLEHKPTLYLTLVCAVYLVQFLLVLALIRALWRRRT